MTGLEQREALIRVREGLSQRKTTTSRVLVVGSCAEEMYPMCQRLRSFGWDLMCCSSISAAEIHIAEVNLAIVFLDMQQWADTFHLIKHVKTTRPDCFVIILTGRSDVDYRECKEALVLGADAIMLKPMTDEQLSMLFNRT